MIKKISFLFIAIAILGICFWEGYHLYNKTNQSAGSEKIDESIVADSLYQQYQQDEHAADAKYIGKIIEVKGILAEIDHNGNTDILILSPQKTGGGVTCQMFPQDKTSAASYPKIGNTITIKGKCTGFLMDVSLVDCAVE